MVYSLVTKTKMITDISHPGYYTTENYMLLAIAEQNRIAELDRSGGCRAEPFLIYSDDMCDDQEEDDGIMVIINLAGDKELEKFRVCQYCQSIGRPEHVYSGHLKEDCINLKNMRCNYCCNFGHTGGYCTLRTPDMKPTTYK